MSRQLFSLWNKVFNKWKYIKIKPFSARPKKTTYNVDRIIKQLFSNDYLQVSCNTLRYSERKSKHNTRLTVKKCLTYLLYMAEDRKKLFVSL